MTCRLAGAKSLSEPMLECCWLDPWEQTPVKSLLKFVRFHSKCCLQNGGHFVSASMYQCYQWLQINHSSHPHGGVTALPQGGSDLGEAVFGIVQILAHLVSRVSRPQFCWGLAILCDPPFFSGYIEFGGVVVKFYSSVEITLYLLADFLLQYVTLFQSRDIVKNLVSL